VPIRCGEVLVQPRELIFADFDGIVAIPSEVEDEVLSKAYQNVAKENKSRIDILNGDSLRTVYDRHGIL